MNTRPIETARDADLRLSVRAIERAALRAREIARQTGTPLVISHNGIVELVPPEQIAQGTPLVREPNADYSTR